MPTAALRQITAKQDNQALRARLEAEAARVQISYKASVIDFMVMEGIQDFSELDYATRKSFEAYLEGQSGMKHIRQAQTACAEPGVPHPGGWKGRTAAV